MSTPLETLIIEELECPSCLNYMSPPINQCIEGHNICHFCFSKVSICPKCRGRKSDTARNYALESIFRIMVWPCNNQHLGCQYESSGETIRNHEKYCWFAFRKCPFSEYDNCLWKDTMLNLKQHLCSVHFSNFYEKDRKKFVSQKFKYIKEYHYIFAVIFVYNQFFRLTWEINENEMTRWAVYLMGSPEDAQNYHYKLEIIRGYEPAVYCTPLTFKSVCDAKPTRETTKFGKYNYFTVHKSVLDKYCDPDGSLQYRVTIYRVEIEPPMCQQNSKSQLEESVNIGNEEEALRDIAVLFSERDST